MILVEVPLGIYFDHDKPQPQDYLITGLTLIAEWTRDSKMLVGSCNNYVLQDNLFLNYIVL